MTVIDLNLILNSGHFTLHSVKGMAYEYRPNSFCPDHGFSAAQRISQMRQTIPRPLQSPAIFVHGSISLYGICSVKLSRKSAGHRSLSACSAVQTVSYGHPKSRFSFNTCLCQRNARLAHLCRLCTSLDSYCQAIVCKRRTVGRTGSNGVCTRFDNDRLVSFTVPVGAISPTQGRRKNAHTARSAGQHPHVYTHFGRPIARCQYSRREY